ncbi:uncharacterized protein A4U43_C03F20410 [Asparagus officinalis]|uniref:Heparanase-like protein 1 n=1 Tax=Asparagus officinalis TaxID=4686 RepID=A0A5P1FCK9_ASPOF|nr:heparanase-like protein 1 [Asparagus officinalis]XP_020257604.1 heparanase-like protein 1 [Asparagus officinalis]ONK75774.1 uncharacterized protein A4U43_C03F20410 [Asparagus officinalis]
MFFQTILFLVLYWLPGISSEGHLDVAIVINGSGTIASNNDDFVCATLDWWPSEKCNYNQCPWGGASVLNMDLNHPILANAIKAFKPLRIRIGGSLQDKVVYDVGNLGYPCEPFSKMDDRLFGFSKGCLSMARWDELNLLFQNTGAVMTFGLNALIGRYHVRNGIWSGAWNSSNARDFIDYTISKGYPVDSWEFGNELSGHGIGARVGVEQYGKDVINLRSILDELYKDSSLRALLVAPGGFYEQQWYSQLLEVSGSGVVNAMTHHIYNLGAGNDLNIKHKIIDPQYLSQIEDAFRGLQLTIQRHGPWSSAWVSEAGGSYNSGSPVVSNAFLNSLWYLDQLGMASKYDTKVYCRQSLIGGNYGLLDTETFIPNPDYYSALLWHRVMGKGVLSIDLSGSPHLRAYAHCRKDEGGVTLLLINLSKYAEFEVSVHNKLNVDLDDGVFINKNNSFVHSLKRTVSWFGRKGSDGYEKREEYHLTAMNGNHLGREMLLNGNLLQLTEDGNIPDMNPVYVPVNSPVSVAPLSVAFVVFPQFEARPCA